MLSRSLAKQWQLARSHAWTCPPTLNSFPPCPCHHPTSAHVCHRHNPVIWRSSATIAGGPQAADFAARLISNRLPSSKPPSTSAFARSPQAARSTLPWPVTAPRWRAPPGNSVAAIKDDTRLAAAFSPSPSNTRCIWPATAPSPPSTCLLQGQMAPR